MKQHTQPLDRKTFISAGLSFAATGLAAAAGAAATPAPDYDGRQKEIDLVSNIDYGRYLKDGDTRSFAALKRLDDAFDAVLADVRRTTVTDPDRPAVWYLYNMGVIVKTCRQTFAIDLVHRKALEAAPLLDFALITHNHGDHCDGKLHRALDAAKKTVVSNFLCNYGAKVGGYTRARKTFTFGDVTVKTALTDHNGYLIDFTTAYEVQIGNFTLFHSGDCSNYQKLQPSRRPDLWFVHPYCGMKTAVAAEKAVHPARVVISHLQELGHAKDRWRWTYRDGLKVKNELAAAGFASIVPLWGDRLV